jgi:crotonobetaine/carnitine-CoA ligase
MRLERTAPGQPGYEKYGLFTTVEEVVSHARETIPPDKVLVQRADGVGISVGEYLDAVNRICNMFLDFGVEKNRHVGVFLSNCIEYTYLYTALGLLGVPMVPLNPFLKGDSLEYVLNHCDVQYLVTNRELFSEKIVPIASSLRKVNHLLYVGDEITTDRFASVSAFDRHSLYSPEFKRPWNLAASDLEVIWLTSGTTGLPKGVETTQEYLLQRTSFSVNYFDMTPSDVIYFVLPMYHIPFHNWGLFMAMISGCTVVTVDWFSASRFWQHVAKYRATIAYSTGTIMAILLKQEVGNLERQGREHLRIWVPWPLDQPDVAVARWPKTKFLEGYGLTEYAIAATNTLEDPEIGSQGPPTPYTDLKICDQDTGTALPAGEVGEIVVRSKVSPAYMMRGYYNSPEDTRQAVRDGWFHTGDAGYLDDRGRLHFVDRLKDSVRVGGENVPSVQVEAIIKQHPRIMEVAVVGVKGEMGPEMLAHVVLKNGEQLTPDEFFDFCIEKMAYFMVPKYVCIRKELPKTASSKIQKYKLREEGLTCDYVMRKGSAKKTTQR